MKRQLQGIALILVSILLTIGYGDAPFVLDRVAALLSPIVGIVGVVMTFLPDKKN